jgi:hypothetical protein
MPEFRPSNDSQLPSAARCTGVHDRTLLGLVLITLVHTSEALAGDAASIGNTAVAARSPVGDFSPSPASSASTLADPGLFTIPKVDDIHRFSATEFIPRKHTILDHEPAAGTFGEAPMLRGTTIWQRLEEYRSRDGVRLLTLWESRGSMVSLQAGKRGDPSLQWSSRLTNHDGPKRGLLDQLFSVSFAGVGNSLRNATHSTATAAAAKPPVTAAAARLAAPSGSH